MYLGVRCYNSLLLYFLMFHYEKDRCYDSILLFIYFLMFYYEKDTLKDSDKNYEVTRIINIVFVHTLHPN